VHSSTAKHLLSAQPRGHTVTPGVLPQNVHELLFEIETHPMTMCYKMLLLMHMAELSDSTGSSLRALAERFQEFFVTSSVQNKVEENPKRVEPGTLSRKAPLPAEYARNGVPC
jgi:hypothetical protein